MSGRFAQAANTAGDSARPGLDQILAHKRAEVAAMKAEGVAGPPVEGLAPSRRSLETALRAPGPSFVFEFKKASPSRGEINRAASPEGIAKLYSAEGAAISVLTDSRFFGGSLEDLRRVAGATDKPVLAKDFIFDPIQILRAREAGADAVLLMLSVVDDGRYDALAGLAKRLNLDVVTEVHDQAELRRAINLRARIIGINNRNFNDLTVSVETTRRLAPMIPPGTVILSESGIADRSDILALAPLVDGFLIGTAVMSAADPARKIKQLVFGDVKVCGLTRRQAARDAAARGARYGGLIFVPESPRSLDIAQAREIAGSNELAFVGVFRNAPLKMVAATAGDLALSVVQLHGDEDTGYRRALRLQLPPDVEIWQARRVKDRVPGGVPPLADRVLFDTYLPSLAGGTGLTFDWRLISGFRGLNKAVLAGGLNPGNAFMAAKTGVGILDVNSGVESAPGRKCPQKLGAFFAALRGLDRGQREVRYEPV